MAEHSDEGGPFAENDTASHMCPPSCIKAEAFESAQVHATGCRLHFVPPYGRASGSGGSRVVAHAGARLVTSLPVFGHYTRFA